jgi:hypothetical protein
MTSRKPPPKRSGPKPKTALVPRIEPMPEDQAKEIEEKGEPDGGGNFA